MKPDLVSVNAVALNFSTKLHLNDDVVNAIHKVSPPDEDGDSSFLDSYALRRHGHGVVAWVISPAEDTEDFRISFNYAPTKYKQLPKKVSKVAQLIDILLNLKQKVAFDCSATFQFSRREHISPVVILPIRISRTKTLPFDEVRGLRFVKLEGNKILYSVILDLTPEGALHQNIGFSYPSNFSMTLADNILHEATDISRKFTSREREK